MATEIDIEMPLVVQRVAEQIERGFRNLSPAESVAGVIVSSGKIAAGLAALDLLGQLRERHTRRDWGGAVTPASEPGYRSRRVTVCAACNVAWPCRDAELLGIA